MAGLSTEHAEVVIETALSLLWCEFAILAEFRRDVRFHSGPVLGPLMVLGGSTTRGVGGVVGVGEGGCRMGRNGVGGDVRGGGGFCMLADFGLALPIACVKGLQEGSQFSK